MRENWNEKKNHICINVRDGSVYILSIDLLIMFFLFHPKDFNQWNADMMGSNNPKINKSFRLTQKLIYSKELSVLQ